MVACGVAWQARDVLSPREVRDVESMCCMQPRYQGPNSFTGYKMKSRREGWDGKLENTITYPKEDQGAANARMFDRGAAKRPQEAKL